MPPAIHCFTVRSLSAFAITETELKLMAAAAIIGFSCVFPGTRAVDRWRPPARSHRSIRNHQLD